MDRREFLKACALAGVSLAGSANRAEAAVGSGSLRLVIHANGGWDPTELCDPKGALSASDPAPINHYLASAIVKTGHFRHSPHPGFADFFSTHQPLVVNGIALKEAVHLPPPIITSAAGPSSPPHGASSRPRSPDESASQIEIALSAFRLGVTTRAELRCGGFDTHVNHDILHIAALARLLTDIDDLWQQAARLKLADHLTVIVTSEMGRAPFYNARGGKAHWPVTSLLAMGAGIPKNKVLGGTDSQFGSVRFSVSG